MVLGTCISGYLRQDIGVFGMGDVCGFNGDMYIRVLASGYLHLWNGGYVDQGIYV